MRVYTTSAEHLKVVTQLLLRGEVVAIPTETVYGLAADATNSEAVERIYTIKGRPAHNPLIIHVADQTSAERYVTSNPTARTLMDAFWPGPLTLVLPKKKNIPDIVTAGLSTVGIRCPRHTAMHTILTHIDRPLAAPSANPSNYISPTRIEHITRHLEGKLHYAIDGGPCEAGLESTILDLSDEHHPKLLRPGPITVEAIEAVIQVSVRVPEKNEVTVEHPITSPGQLKVHYSPHTPLILLTEPITDSGWTPAGRTAVIHFSKSHSSGWRTESMESFFLSDNNDACEAAVRLYDLLQQLDQSHFDRIFVEPIPSTPDWNAIGDRLKRAASTESVD